ncbi:hypothetical protein BM1_09796 [Bipolaris maydis]|nr:hypothetical protein BM1_09796 [Bipolaris maydis]
MPGTRLAASAAVTTVAAAAAAAGQRRAGKAASSSHEPGCRGGGPWMLCRRLLQHADRTNDQGPNWLGHWLVTLPYPTLPYPNTADVRGTIPLDRKGHGHLRLFTIVCPESHANPHAQPGKVPVGVSKSYSGPAAQSRLAWRAFIVETDDSPCQASWRQRRWHAAWPTLGVEGQSSHAPLLAPPATATATLVCPLRLCSTTNYNYPAM